MKKKFRILFTLCVALVVLALPGSPILAASSADGTVTATPAILDLSYTSGSTWTLNGITGSGKILNDTAYYANPLGDTTAPSATIVDGECLFDLDNASNVITSLYCDVSHFTGGDAMQNSDTGSNGVGEFGAYSWYSGMTYTGKVIAKTTGSSVLKSALAADTDIKAGIEIETQSDSFASVEQMTSTYTFYLVMD